MAWEWTTKKELAAGLVAEDRLTNEEIAKRVGVTRQALDLWKREPEFVNRVEGLIADFREAVRKRGIATRERRVASLNERWNKMLQVIQDRADASRDEAPGESTGLLVKTYRAVGRGDDFQLLDEWSVDTGLLKELREHERQAAQELGQWTEKHEHTGRDGGPILTADAADLSGLSDEDLENLGNIAHKLAGE